LNLKEKKYDIDIDLSNEKERSILIDSKEDPPVFLENG